MLDATDRVKPVSDMDVGRVRWAFGLLDETRKFSTVLGDIAVCGEFVASETWAPGMLRRVGRDVEIDV
eukprot:9830066-Lingulodinium_polyedra.AAC.1